jgi:hypothetical protein
MLLSLAARVKVGREGSLPRMRQSLFGIKSILISEIRQYHIRIPPLYTLYRLYHLGQSSHDCGLLDQGEKGLAWG